MKVDFYQLGEMPAETVIAAIADKVLANDERLLVVAGEEGHATRLDRLLWNDDAFSFRPHGLAGGVDDARQPVLISTSEDAPNGARNFLIADGQWRESALGFDRAFFLFDGDSLAGARSVWKGLAERDGVERRYFAHDEGKWIHKG